MRKKIVVMAMAMASLALSALGIAACNEHTHTLEYVAAVPASCETEGHTEHWFCTECGQYFADKNGKEKIPYSEVVIRVLGHDIREVAAVEPTCTEPGNTAGFTCARCDYSTVVVLPPSHDMTHHAEVPATCLKDGVREYWTCSREEGVYYANEKGTATLDDISIAAKGHDMTEHPEVPATCTADGVMRHWTCSREEGVYYADGEGAETLDSLAIPATGHEMKYVDALAPTCTQDGYEAHWACAHEEGVYYADRDGSEKLGDVTVSATGHDWEEQLSSDETHHWYACKNGCGEEDRKEAHDWGDGTVKKTPTTKEDGERFFHCETCGKEKTEIIPKLGTFTLSVTEKDIYDGQDGGTVAFVCDTEPEDGKYVEGSVVTVTVTLNEGFGIGAIALNGNELVDSPLATDGVYTFRFTVKEDAELSVEFGKLVTTERVWNLRDGGGANFAFPWEYYKVDAAQDGNGIATLYVYDATGIPDVRAHDFTADEVFFTRDLAYDQALQWAVFDSEVNTFLHDLMRDMPAESAQYEFTLAFAIRLFPSAAKRASGYVAGELIFPNPTTVGGVDYDMTADYVCSQADLTAPRTPQFSINEQGTALEFLRGSASGNGSVFTTYHASYIEIEMRNGEDTRYAYLFNDDGTLNMYSGLEKTGTPLSLGSVGNAWIATAGFESWAAAEYPGAFISVTYGWEFRTKVHVGEGSYWVYDGEWSDVIKYVAFNAYETPSFEQMGFSEDGTALEFVRLGGKGLLFTQYHASYVEIEVRKGETVYTMYLLYDGQNRSVYLSSDPDGEGETLRCGAVDNASVGVVEFNAWASKEFEADFNALEWEYRTKVHIDGDGYDGYWFEDGKWSETIKYNAK